MRLRISVATGLAAVLMFTGACATNDTDSQSAGTSGATPASAPAQPDTATTVDADEQAEGVVLEVNPLLLQKGFKQDSITALEKNAAYRLWPFKTEAEVAAGPPGTATCAFLMTHKNYKKGDGFADHHIKERSVVRLTGYLVARDGKLGPMLQQQAEVPFSDLTPQWLADADAAFGGLGVCQDRTLR